MLNSTGTAVCFLVVQISLPVGGTFILRSGVDRGACALIVHLRCVSFGVVSTGCWKSPFGHYFNWCEDLESPVRQLKMTFAFNDKNPHLGTFVLAVPPAGNGPPTNMCGACCLTYRLLCRNIPFSETKYPCPPTGDGSLLSPRTITPVTTWCPCTLWSVLCTLTQCELHQGWTRSLSFLLKAAHGGHSINIEMSQCLFSTFS